jgi:ribonuclease PH
MNLVMDSNYQIIEIQGAGEKRSYAFHELDSMITIAKNGIEKLFQIQNEILKLC